MSQHFQKQNRSYIHKYKYLTQKEFNVDRAKMPDHIRDMVISNFLYPFLDSIVDLYELNSMQLSKAFIMCISIAFGVTNRVNGKLVRKLDPISIAILNGDIDMKFRENCIPPVIPTISSRLIQYIIALEPLFKLIYDNDNIFKIYDKKDVPDKAVYKRWIKGEIIIYFGNLYQSLSYDMQKLDVGIVKTEIRDMIYKSCYLGNKKERDAIIPVYVQYFNMLNMSTLNDNPFKLFTSSISDEFHNLDFNGMNLENVALGGSFIDCNFSNCTFGASKDRMVDLCIHVTMNQCNLENTIFRSYYQTVPKKMMNCIKSSFYECGMKNVDLSGISKYKLSACNFSRCDLTGAIYTNHEDGTFRNDELRQLLETENALGNTSIFSTDIVNSTIDSSSINSNICIVENIDMS